VRVPADAALGKAKLTLSVPGWKEGKVAPVTLEVPVVEPNLNPANLAPIRQQKEPGKKGDGRVIVDGDASPARRDGGVPCEWFCSW
jgi:hypothetical protein